MINFNGKIFSGQEPIIQMNRAMLYGDGLFETIRIHDGEILFFEDHCERMISGMTALKLEVSSPFSSFYFHKQIIELAGAANIHGNARIRIGIFRSADGFYEPEDNTASYFIEVFPLRSGFEWSEEKCEAGIFADVPKNFSAISSFKSMNALPYVMAAVFRKENQLGDCFLLNSFGKVADTISSNVFWIEKQTLFTPPSTDGGVAGIMQKNLTRILKENHFNVQERSIVPDELLNADEIFLTNVIRGIKPVTGFGPDTYPVIKTREIFDVMMRQLNPYR